MKKNLASILFLSFSIAAIASNTSFYFDHPATVWEETLPLGNGRIGMMPWGNVEHERVVLNEITLWSGQKQETDNPEAGKYLPQIRQLLFEGKNYEAQALMYKTFTCLGKGSAGTQYGAYQVFADLCMDFTYSGSSKTSDYKESLDLKNGMVTTSFKKGKTTYTREFFTSMTEDVGVIHLTSNAKKAISLSLYLTRTERFSTKINGNQFIIEGQLDNGTDGKGMKYYGTVTVRSKAGVLTQQNGKLLLSNADEADLIVSMATNYFEAHPEKAVNTLSKTALKKNYFSLKKAHTTAFSSYFDRVSVTLPENKNSNLPIDKRLCAFQKDSTDADMAALYMQYGRYLLISSTRNGNLPPNLQGLWAEKTYTPWNGDYHLNINLQMNLWPAEVGNLSELHLPMINFTESLVKPGTKTAKIYYNSDGWVTHMLTNVWGFTSPAEDPSWGATNTAGAWLCEDIWEHYLFTKDLGFLKKYYHVLRGASVFFSDMLVKDPRSGYLITAPTTSPENQYYDDAGRKVNISAGSTMDNQIVRELFSNTIAAARLLNEDKELCDTLSFKLAQLSPDKIGSQGQIMEWLQDYKEVDVHHRHVSQLYGLHPSNQITYNKTPELMKAAKTTLERRGDNSTGWSMAWKINFWARLKDGNRCYKLFHDLLTPAENHSGTYPNLFSAHPPMQIDGNFGGSAGIMEMLVQSQDSCIEFLPALPSVWSHGEVHGLKVRGGGIISIKWNNGQVQQASLFATCDNQFRIKTDQPIRINAQLLLKPQNGFVSIALKQGEKVQLNF